MSLPTGTVTFLFTDIEGSTRLWEDSPAAMSLALARHDALLSQAIEANDGVVFKTVGDAFCAAFASAPAALAAALISQLALQSEPWPEELTLRVRMALHTGLADVQDGDYFGPPLNRVARLLSAGHGGQTLLSLPIYELTRDTLPPGSTMLELGSHALRDLARPEQVFQLCHPDLLSDFPLLKSLDSLPNNLPQQVTSFIGRERELTQVKDLLAKTRLLTLTGSGGCGKTRLSLQAAADALDAYPDGVWLVELAPIADPDLVPQAVAGILGVKEQLGKTMIQVLTEHLKTKTLLLVLDNCEHVLNACAKLATDLLRACPNVKILASSREGLGIAGEQTYRIPSLSLPDPKTTQTPESLSQYEAVQLFIDRAAASLPAFRVTNENAPALASVCHRLDGIPLAIELAAARVRSLAVEEINHRLDNRFRLLTGGSRTALPRQQTLRALIDWSYDLLIPPEKTLLARLSVFSGGWTLAAAEAVDADEDIEDWEVLDLLTSLVDKSLVIADEAAGQTRYRLLETVRQYARDRLAEGDEGLVVRGKHRDYFLTLIEEVRPKLQGPEQAHWLSVVETEHDNLRQVITFCLDDPDAAEKGLRLGAALRRFWELRSHLSEGREWLTALLSQPDAQVRTRTRADALNGAGNMARMQGDFAVARPFYQESLSIYRELGSKQGIGDALINLGLAASDLGDYALARSLTEESLDINRALGNKQGIATSLHSLGRLAYQQGDYALARSFYEESLDINRELGNKHGIAFTIINLGLVARMQGDYALARSFLDESLAINRELGDRNGIARSLNSLGQVAHNQGDYALAQSLFHESLAIERELGNKYGIAHSLSNLGDIAQRQGDLATAYALHQESLTINRELGNRSGIAAAFINLGEVARMQGDARAARSWYTESLTLFREMGDREAIAFILEAVAALAMNAENAERAALLFGAAEALRAVMGVSQTPAEAEEHDRQVAAVREVLGEEAFAAAWAEGRAMTLDQAVAEAYHTGT